MNIFKVDKVILIILTLHSHHSHILLNNIYLADEIDSVKNSRLIELNILLLEQDLSSYIERNLMQIQSKKSLIVLIVGYVIHINLKNSRLIELNILLLEQDLSSYIERNLMQIQSKKSLIVLIVGYVIHINLTNYL